MKSLQKVIFISFQLFFSFERSVAKVAYSMGFGWVPFEGMFARLMLLNLFGTF